MAGGEAVPGLSAGEALGIYLRHLKAERNLSSSTIRNYRGAIEGLFAYLSGRGIEPLT